ncbi:histidine kinase [Chryseolinea sp. H1M3-3]|uniref:sensor histidine kinase n=1 Tax=Chryseolinea sp. H1M3-3 TaxID=3034144 RepID=UPI0023EC810F|nr:histidine kinase [Chryseolinea sp. H1M3-3]
MNFWRYKMDHVIFWVATVGFHMFTKINLIDAAGFDQFALEVVIRNGLLALLIYVNLLVLIPKYAQQKKIIAYAFLLFTALGLYVFLKNAHDVYLYAYVLGDESRSSLFYSTYYNFSIAIFYLAFSVALALSKAWYFQRELIRKMEVEKLSSELEYLKAQINPHFVFNSINTIYFQIDKQNTHARESLSAFSEMLRYQLYECNGHEIPIEKEIIYLENYVELQRIRKDENYNISFIVDDNLKGFTISPLLLIPFVENAFKHVSHYPHKNQVRIAIGKHQNNLKFSVLNTKENKTATKGHAGIGLKNAKRRLELLYKDRHQLVIDDAPDSYEVNLSLQIS